MDSLKNELQIYKIKNTVLESCIQKLLSNDIESYNKIMEYINNTCKIELKKIDTDLENKSEIYKNIDLNLIELNDIRYFLKKDNSSYYSILNKNKTFNIETVFYTSMKIFDDFISIFKKIVFTNQKYHNFKIFKLENNITNKYIIQYFILDFDKNNNLIWNEILFDEFIEELLKLIELLQNKFNYKKLNILIKYLNKYYKTSNKFKERTKLHIENNIDINFIESNTLCQINVNNKERHINNNIDISFYFKKNKPKINYLNLTIIENCDSLRE